MSTLLRGPAGGTRHGQSLRARHAAKVAHGPGCWEWTGSLTSHGYGRIRVRHADGSYRPEQAHRVAYELAHGPIPAGLVVRHACDNPSCCNPEHLLLGTQADNVADMIARGRQSHAGLAGEDHPRARLTEDDVRSIRRARAEGALLRELAVRFGIGLSQVSRICRGQGWTTV